MKAAQVDLVEGKPRLVVGQAPEPLPAPGELLVAVRAIGVNRADLLLRPDHFQSFPARERPPIPGIEAAGEVVGLGAGVDGFAIGDRVAGLTPGAYAERVAMPAGLAWRVPPALDWVQAASLPLAVCTAHDALTGSGRLQRGDAVAVLGATTSVGRIAIALARQLGAAEVVGTTRSIERDAIAAELGLDAALGPDPEEIGARLQRCGSGRGVGVVVDMIGGELSAGALFGMAIGGRWVQVGRMGAATATIDLNELSRRRVHLVGATFRTRTLDECVALAQAAWRDAGDIAARGALRLPIDRVFPLDDAAQAHERLRAAGAGRVMMTA